MDTYDFQTHRVARRRWDGGARGLWATWGRGGVRVQESRGPPPTHPACDAQIALLRDPGRTSDRTSDRNHVDIIYWLTPLLLSLLRGRCRRRRVPDALVALLYMSATCLQAASCPQASCQRQRRVPRLRRGSRLRRLARLRLANDQWPVSGLVHYHPRLVPATAETDYEKQTAMRQDMD